MAADLRLREHRARPWRVCEALGIASTAVLWLALALRVGTAASWDVPRLLGLAPAFLLGLLGADLASGIVHFACDRFGSEHTPLLGRAFIAPFRDHHRDPRGIARHGVCERNGNNCIALLPCLLLGHAMLADAPLHGLRTLVYVALLALLLALALTNEAHAFAHGLPAPRLVRALQRANVIMSERSHAQHHAGDHARAYCITTGWLNAPLDRARAWSVVERWLRLVVCTAGRARTP